ncbi:MAG: PP2C family protein-serine/threonine phosphatase [Oscillatoria sp. PMC 1068.18]|nr:PP2C family protein-serine/threonine phosphatase [Oscillatoria sp. PMC 1076.18]MEC4987904.1 PP2C family protein-serine/threonine phosphatase [Oscillatoria sp. PMC 1068.18]
MTAAPLPRHQLSEEIDQSDSNPIADGTPILALKELVSNLHREQRKVQNLLSSLGFALRSFNNLNQFLELIPLMATRVTDADGGALILFKPNGQIRLERLHCVEGNACQDLRQVLAQAIKTATANQQANENESFSENLDAQLKEIIGSEVHTFGTSILVKSVERGRLYIFSGDRNYLWTPTRQKLVQLVADQTAVAIANHDLTVELRKKERLDRELEIASEIQLQLLPRKCPKIKGVELAAACKTANRVGGDYYDFIPANYDQLQFEQQQDPEEATSVPWSIVIGDVMGKGVPAGLIMTMTRGMLRAEVLNRHTPARILQHLNRVMYADLENNNRFVTLFYSEYDPNTGILSYSNAAHNPPLLWKASDRTIEKIDSAGMLIGLDTDSEYEDAQTQLAPGDVVMYYTDGFTDAVNQNGSRFDEENLLRAFEWGCQQYNHPQAILEHLFDSVQNFIGAGNSNGDDMTLVIMQIQSTA